MSMAVADVIFARSPDTRRRRPIGEADVRCAVAGGAAERPSSRPDRGRAAPIAIDDSEGWVDWPPDESATTGTNF